MSADFSRAQDAVLTHERAHSLLLKQRETLLPPADANALAEHLLDCDSCYRYAQDVAAQQHSMRHDCPSAAPRLTD
ncbi:MAG: hypothetical protein ABI068_10525, partial [Ktedonobacterales bacterium]